MFDHLVSRWRDLFNATFDVLLYDLTSTYFESDPPLDEEDKRRHGYSRDHRPDCVQVVIALVVTREGLPLAYEMLAGNSADSATLQGFLARFERQYGKARRVWCMDRGVPTKEVLAQMRASDQPVQYLVGTPKGRLTRLEKALLDEPWCAARPGQTLTPRAVLEKFAAVQMIDVYVPTTDGRELCLTRDTQPAPELKLLLEKLKLTLPAQAPPKITVAEAAVAIAP